MKAGAFAEPVEGLSAKAREFSSASLAVRDFAALSVRWCQGKRQHLEWWCAGVCDNDFFETYCSV